MKNIFNDSPMLLDKTLACILGLKEAIILSQINYWIEINKKNKRNHHEGRYWTYNSINKWGEEFSFLSISSIKRALNKLREMNIIITGNFNTYQMDRTLWYSINYDELERLVGCNKKDDKSISSDKVDDDNVIEQMEKEDLNQALPETSTKNSTGSINKSISHCNDITKKNDRQSERKSGSLNEFDLSYKNIMKKCELNFIDKNYKDAVGHALKLLLLDVFKKNEVKMGDSYIPSDIMKNDMNKLDFFTIEHAINKFKEASRSINIKNTIAYLKTCIYNSINEMKIETDCMLRYSGVVFN